MRENPARALILTAFLAAPALPQPCLPVPGTGDFLLTHIPGSIPQSSPVLRLQPLTGVVTTLSVISQPAFGNWVTMDQDNAGIVLATVVRVIIPNSPPQPSPLIRWPRPGGQQTIATLPTVLQSHDLDADGTWLCALGDANTHITARSVLRVDPATGAMTTLVTNGAARGTFNALCVDGDTGDVLIGLYDDQVGGGALLRMARGTNAITTVAGGLGRIYSIDFEPATGSCVVSRTNPVELLRVTPGGLVTTVASGLIVNALKVHDESGNLVVAGGADVSILTSGGTVVGTRTITGFSFTGIEIDGSRKVSGSGVLAGGQVYAVRFSFPLSPCATYVAALSGSLRPGIPLADGRTIHLAIDPLFLLSLGGLPGFTTGFSGTLDASGGADGAILPPPGFPAGIRLYVSAVALNPALPAGLDTANSLGVTSQ